MFWRLLSRASKVMGGLALAALVCAQLYLIHTWRFSRPFAPDPAAGWTVTLPGCLGAYGAPKEKALLVACREWTFAAAAIVLFGVGLDYYRSRSRPAKRKSLE
jgi:hypothetical protein